MKRTDYAPKDYHLMPDFGDLMAAFIERFGWWFVIAFLLSAEVSAILRDLL